MFVLGGPGPAFGRTLGLRKEKGPGQVPVGFLPDPRSPGPGSFPQTPRPLWVGVDSLPRPGPVK